MGRHEIAVVASCGAHHMRFMNPQANRRTPARRRAFAARSAWAGSLLALTGCTPAGLLTQFDRIAHPSGVRRVANGVPYAAGPRQKLDVWSPSKRSDEPLPVVIFFYGGGWNAGSRGDYGFAGAAFASRQFIAVIPDYRLVPQFRFPSFVEDGAIAVRWTRDNISRYGGDPKRISVAGHSAGAFNAAMLVLDPRYLNRAGVDARTIRAAALLSGPYDFYPFTEGRGRAAFGAYAGPRDSQPINFVRKDAPPIFLAHGSKDRIVLPRNSRALAERLQRAGAPVALRIYEGASHVEPLLSLAGPFRSRLPVLDESAAFLKEHTR